MMRVAQVAADLAVSDLRPAQLPTRSRRPRLTDACHGVYEVAAFGKWSDCPPQCPPHKVPTTHDLSVIDRT
jgi:hypothetical protein